jgi:hypothetical protein
MRPAPARSRWLAPMSYAFSGFADGLLLPHVASAVSAAVDVAVAEYDRPGLDADVRGRQPGGGGAFTHLQRCCERGAHVLEVEQPAVAQPSDSSAPMRATSFTSAASAVANLAPFSSQCSSVRRVNPVMFVTRAHLCRGPLQKSEIGPASSC